MVMKEPCAKCDAIIDRRTDGFGIDPEKGLLCISCWGWEKNSAKHTPTPWVAEPEEASKGRGIAICAPTNGWIVATITPEDNRPADAIDWANARLILQAVNSHEDLIAAYEQVEGAFLDAFRALNDAGLLCQPPWAW